MPDIRSAQIYAFYLFDVNELTDRTENALKFIGDIYDRGLDPGLGARAAAARGDAMTSGFGLWALGFGFG